MENKTTISSEELKYYTLKLYLEEVETSELDNTSTIKYQLSLHSGNTSFEQWGIGWIIKLAGTTVSSQNVDSATQRYLSENSSIIITEGTTIVNHNNDGSLDMSAYAILDFDSNLSYLPDEISLNGSLMLTILDPQYAACQCYIYNGSNWELYEPYIYNDTGWEVYSVYINN